MEKNSTSSYTTPKSSSKKKLKLFGIEIGSSHHDQTHDDHRSFDSSIGSSGKISSRAAAAAPQAAKNKKFECQWCLKVLANSQALGGHQNAHKKERRREKWLQLQASRAAGDYILNHHHLQPLIYDSFRYNGFDHAWPSDHQDDQFYNNLDDDDDDNEGNQQQISFCSDENNWVPLIQQDMNRFSLTHTDRASSNSTDYYYDYYSNKICRDQEDNLDLQLGLG